MSEQEKLDQALVSCKPITDLLMETAATIADSDSAVELARQYEIAAALGCTLSLSGTVTITAGPLAGRDLKVSVTVDPDANT